MIQVTAMRPPLLFPDRVILSPAKALRAAPQQPCLLFLRSMIRSAEQMWGRLHII